MSSLASVAAVGVPGRVLSAASARSARRISTSAGCACDMPQYRPRHRRGGSSRAVSAAMITVSSPNRPCRSARPPAPTRPPPSPPRAARPALPGRGLRTGRIHRNDRRRNDRRRSGTHRNDRPRNSRRRSGRRPSGRRRNNGRRSGRRRGPAANRVGLGRLGVGQVLGVRPGHVPGPHRGAGRHLHRGHEAIVAGPVSRWTTPARAGQSGAHAGGRARPDSLAAPQLPAPVERADGQRDGLGRHPARAPADRRRGAPCLHLPGQLAGRLVGVLLSAPQDARRPRRRTRGRHRRRPRS